MENKVTAVYGSPESGKTVTAVKIAKALADQKQNVMVVSCDDQVPLIPLLLPDIQDAPSLGSVLAADQLSQIDILRHCVPYGKNPYISLLGYGRGENIMSYPEYGFQRASELIGALCRFEDNYVLVDCSSSLDNYLTAAALKQAGVTLRVLNADPKSLLYFQSAAPLLRRSPEYRYDRQVCILNNVLPSQDTGPARELAGEIPYTLPAVPELKEQYDSARLLDTVFGRTARQYTMEIKKLVKEVLTGEPEHGIVRRRKEADTVS